MLDIETLSTAKNAIVLSVGAVLFNPFDHPGVFLGEWHEPIELEAQGGRQATIDTVMWWMSQSEAGAAMTQLRKDRVPVSLIDLRTELELFAKGELIDDPTTRTAAQLGATGLFWSNAPTFDLNILRDLFESKDLKCPWSFREERDFRTLYQEFGSLVSDSEIAIDGVRHDALFDAKRQAAKVQQIYAALYGKEIA